MKRFLILLLTLICAFSFSLAFIACDTPDDDGGANNEGANNGEVENGGENNGGGNNGGANHPDGPNDEIPFACTYQDGGYVITGIGNVSGYDIVIPDELDGVPVTKIADSAFANSFITKVTIGKNVTDIGVKAFYYSDLKEVVFGENVINLGKECFAYSKLTEVTIPSKMTEIAESAFYRCYYLKKAVIPDSVTLIKKNAFANSGSSSVGKELVIEGANNIVEIEDNAFDNSAITTFNFPDTLKVIRSSAFSASKLKNVVLPEQLTTVTAELFKSCSMLESITLNKNLQSIGASAFKFCVNLKTINFAENGSLTEIGTGSFYGCTSLTIVEIPDYVTRLGVNSFAKCTGLEKMIIGTGVNFIGAGSFSYNYEYYINKEPYDSSYRMLDYLEFKSPENWIQSTNEGTTASDFWWPPDTPENTAKHYHNRSFFHWMKGTQLPKNASAS